MKLTELGLVVLLCVLMVAVSGLVVSQEPANGLYIRAQGAEAAAKVHEAKKDHVSAARDYVEAAEHYDTQAAAMDELLDTQGAAESYVKAAAMYAAARKHTRAHLKHVLVVLGLASPLEQVSLAGLMTGYAEMDYYKEERLMHEMAAECYGTLAGERAAAGLCGQALEMNLIAAVRLEASAACAVANDEHGPAAHLYHYAAGRYKAHGDRVKVRSMVQAAAERYKAHAENIIANFDADGHAIFFFRYAAKSYEESDNVAKARLMNEKVVQLREAFAGEAVVSIEELLPPTYFQVVGEAYEKLDQPVKAESMKRMAARKYEASAMAWQAQNDKPSAIDYYLEAAELYDAIGEPDKARLLRDAADELARIL